MTLRELEQAATPAPWNVGQADDGGGWQPQIWPSLGAPIARMERREGRPGLPEADAAFIAAFRNKASLLLDVVEAARALLSVWPTGLERQAAADKLHDALDALDAPSKVPA